MGTEPTKWAIAGAGRISSSFTTGVKMLPSCDHQVVAVGSRSISRATDFAKQFDISKAYGSYEELAQDKDVDIVYVGVIHPCHFPLIKLFLNSGKHVLCEKPLTVNAKQAKEVVDIARKKRLFLMEGFWSRFFPVYKDLQTELAAGTIGEPRVVTANFGLVRAGRGWMADKKTGAGSWLGMGCYGVQFSQLVYKGEKPEKIVASGILSEESAFISQNRLKSAGQILVKIKGLLLDGPKSVPGKQMADLGLLSPFRMEGRMREIIDGYDLTISATLTYSGQRIAQIMSSAICGLDQTASVYGSKTESGGTEGIIKIPNFWSPEEMTLPSGTIRHPVPKSTNPPPHGRGEGFMYQAQSVRECLLKGLTENPAMTLDQSIQILEINDEIRRQVGLVYDEDLP